MERYAQNVYTVACHTKAEMSDREREQVLGMLEMCAANFDAEDWLVLIEVMASENSTIGGVKDAINKGYERNNKRRDAIIKLAS